MVVSVGTRIARALPTLDGVEHRLAKGERLFRWVLRFGITVRPELTDLRPEGACPVRSQTGRSRLQREGLPTLTTRTRPSALLSGLDGPLSGYPGAVGGATTLGELDE